MIGAFLKCEHCKQYVIPESEENGIEADICPNCHISIFASPQDVIDDNIQKNFVPDIEKIDKSRDDEIQF